MKTFIIACAAAIVLAIIGGVVLNGVEELSSTAYSTNAVRLGA